ncbi:MAG: Lrp/AsnC ligand binding domain-containing protein [Desulfurococcales archaeon]|nr:Lrp/AsnC ligand binding domain-containing protein [Desulfurococcales archaeon]
MVDERDLQLLLLLEEDSRQAWRRIARLLGVSEATVYIRVRKLTERGILEGYSIRVNPEKLGLGACVFVIVKVRADKHKAVKEKLSRTRYVYEAYEISGSYHFLAKITAPTYQDAADIVDEIMAMDGVLEVLSFPVMRKVRVSPGLIRDYIDWSSEGGRARARGHRRA